MKKKSVLQNLFDFMPVLLLPVFYLFLRTGTFRSIQSVHYNMFENTAVFFAFCLAFYLICKLKNRAMSAGLSVALMLGAAGIVPASLLGLFPVLMLFQAAREDNRQRPFLQIVLLLFALCVCLSEGIYITVLNIANNIYTALPKERVVTAVILAANLVLFGLLYVLLKERLAPAKAAEKDSRSAKHSKKSSVRDNGTLADVFKTLGLLLCVLNIVFCVRSKMIFDYNYFAVAAWGLFLPWYAVRTNQTLLKKCTALVARVQKRLDT